MYTPLRKATPAWAGLPSAERRELRDKAKLVSSPELREMATPTSGGTVRDARRVEKTVVEQQVVVQGPPVGSILEANGLLEEGKSEPEIWRRFQEAGALDEESLERKDRAALQDRIASLEAELYDYQYNMGMLLLERKTWNTKFDDLKAAVSNGEENLRREQAAYLAALEEVEKRENVLKKSLQIEKQCVADLEKSLKEMQAEVAEVKQAAEKRLAEAREITAGIDEKALVADSKGHAAEALRAEASRKQADADRKLHEVEAREGALRRERQSFKTEMEARRAELALEEKALKEWEKKLQESQERLLDGERLLARTEEFVNEKDVSLKQVEKDLEESRRLLEKERVVLQQTETSLSAQLAAINLREENAIEREISINKKQQELILSQEMLFSRERVLEQRENHLRETEAFIAKERDRLETLEESLKSRQESLAEQQKAMEAVRKILEDDDLELQKRKAKSDEILGELDARRLSLNLESEKIQETSKSLEEREATLEQTAQAIRNREILVNEKVDSLVLREKDVENKLFEIADREQEIKDSELQFQEEKRLIELDKQEARKGKDEVFGMMKELEIERQQIEEEREKLKAIEEDRVELLRIQTQLKEEIDSYRASKQEVSVQLEALMKDKKEFERKWEILDRKNEELRTEVERFQQESRGKSEWFQVEEERLKNERRELQEEFRRNSEALRLEREAFLGSSEEERSKLYHDIQKEREELVKDIDLRTAELERRIEKEREFSRKVADDKESGYAKEVERQKDQITAARQALQKELEEVEVEREKLSRERVVMLKQREEAEREWKEIRKDIVELQVQGEKLKEQREGLRTEREEILRQAARLKILRDEFRDGESSLMGSEMRVLPNCKNDGEVRSSNDQIELDVGPGTVTVPDVVERTPERLASFSPGAGFAWLQKCFSRPAQAGDSRARQEIFPGIPAGQADITGTPETGGSQNAVESASKSKGTRRGPQRAGSFNNSQLAQVTGTEDAGGKSRGRIKRTRSIKAVVEDAKLILEERKSRDEAIDLGEEGAEESLQHKTVHLSQAVESPEQSQQQSDADFGKAIKSGRKRSRQQSISNEHESDYYDSASQLAGGGKRKKRQGESGANGDSGTRRYNLRHSTIVSAQVAHKLPDKTNANVEKVHVVSEADASLPVVHGDIGREVAAAEAVIAQIQQEVAKQALPSSLVALPDDGLNDAIGSAQDSALKVKERRVLRVELQHARGAEELRLGVHDHEEQDQRVCNVEEAEDVAENGADEDGASVAARVSKRDVGYELYGNNGHGEEQKQASEDEENLDELQGDDDGNVAEGEDEDEGGEAGDSDDSEESEGSEESDESKPLRKKIWDFLTT